MARTGRRQLAVQIKESIFSTLELIKEETGLSNAKVIEMLIENYQTNTAPKYVTEERVAEMIKAALNQTQPIPLVPPQIEEPVQPPVEDFYLLRETCTVGKPLQNMQQYQENGFTWMISFDCKPHFDADGKPIPFRYTDLNGKVVEPDADEIKELEEYYGKPVTIEK